MPVTVSRTISNADALRLVDAYCGKYGYQATISDPNLGTIPNPESRQQFADRMLNKRAFHSIIKEWETGVAAATADAVPDITVSP